MKPVTSETYAFFAVTADVEVAVNSYFLAPHSDPAEHTYVWGYHIRVANGSDRAVQLISRHWIITDANGEVDEVQGPGVVGEQPWIEPGTSFEYSSGCPLRTPSGMMVGTYQMRDRQGRSFDIEIPAFSLDSPFANRTVN